MINKDLILLDLFSGTGGFHKGLSDAGFNFKEVYFSEIDKHAIANYKYNFPNAKHIGSVKNIIQSGIPRPDIITFGSPCQDFSLAGNRKGLAGDKSSLIQDAIAAISHFRPDIFIWENVKGTFSSNSRRDFWAIMQAFANIGGYGCEWQLVNTAWLLPQNRERIYLIGHSATSFRDWRTVFPIREDETITRCTFPSNKNGIQTKHCGAILTGYGRRPTDTFIKASSLNKTSKINVVGKIWNGQDGFVVSDSGLSPTVGAGHGNTPKIMVNSSVMQLNPSTESNGKQPYQHNRIYAIEGLSPALNTDSRPPIVKAVLTPNRRDKRQNGRRMKENGEPAFTLTAQDQHGIFDGTSIRRLTEIECERLQGYPDNWTLYGNYDGELKEISKTQRYKLLGNAVTAKMVELIGLRLQPNFNQADSKRVSLYDDFADDYKQVA